LKKKVVFWVEQYFYNPNLFERVISLLMLPLAWVYCFGMWVRYKLKTPRDFGIKIISIGNLSVGGSGKTPLVTSLAQHYENVAVVLRGYGRKSRGLVVVKDGKNILCDVEMSGDEAMIYASKIQNAIVIVSEDRKKGIEKAKEMGAKIVFLDDAYSKHDIKKLDILIDVSTKNNFCLPAGCFRERVWSGKKVIILKEGLDFKRVVLLKDRCDKMSLVTAIARPSRLDEFLPPVISKHYFEDHHSFTKDEIKNILDNDGADSILVTYKDFVKVKEFDIALSLLDLDVEVSNKVFEIIDNYKG